MSALGGGANIIFSGILVILNFVAFIYSFIHSFIVNLCLVFIGDFLRDSFGRMFTWCLIECMVFIGDIHLVISTEILLVELNVHLVI